MPTKRQILEELKRDELIAAVNRFDLPVADRRVKALLVEALASFRGAAPAELLTEMKRDRLKELCRALDLDDGGREKAVIVSRLVHESRRSTTAIRGDLTSTSSNSRRSVPAASSDRSGTPSVSTPEVREMPPRREEDSHAPPPTAERQSAGAREGASMSAPSSRAASAQERFPAPLRARHRPDRAPPINRRARPDGRPERKQINIQDAFLFESLKEDRTLVFALVTGQFIEGRIKRFDLYSVLVDAGGRVILIYKSAISDISWPGPTSQSSRH